MKRIDELSPELFRGKRVFVRADFNVPLGKNGEVLEAFRIERGWKTVAFLKAQGAKVVVASHIGRDPMETLAPVARALQKLGAITFVPDILGPAAHSAIAAMKDGDAILLENLRRDPRETENDTSFAEELAALADFYIGDAFAAAHRAHASIVGIPAKLPHAAGLLMIEEVTQLSKAREPSTSSFAVLGGAKFETKEPLIKLLLDKYDHLLVTGALANDVFRAKGLPVGRSLVSSEQPGRDVLDHPHFIAPIDVTVEQEDGHPRVKKPDEVQAGDKIVDIGPDTLGAIASDLIRSKFVLWNGPTGLYEDGFTSWTHALAALVAEAVSAGAQAVIGGGDTIAALRESGLTEKQLGFLSTGGGAMLEYLLKGTLPGIDALQ